MPSLSVQNLLLALIVVVPGFIATHFAISLGVIRDEISRWRLLIVSLSASLIVDTLFLSLLELGGGEIRSPTDVKSAFFTPDFRPVLVFGLIILSAVIGILGAVVLAANAHNWLRELIWRYVGKDRHRKPVEPWEGVLDNANRVQVLTGDNSIVVGKVLEYSDDDKEKQIAIGNPEWYEPESDEFQEQEDVAVELLFGDDIQQVTVIDTW